MKLSFGIIWGVSFTFFPIILSKSKDVVLVNQMFANVEVRNTTFQHEICGKDWESDVFVELAWCFLDSSIQGSLNYSYRVLHKKQPSDRTVDSSVGSPRAPQLQSCFFRVVPIGLQKKQPFMLGTFTPFQLQL